MTTKNKTINPDHEAAMEMARALDRNGDVIPDAMAIIRDDCINLARAYLALRAHQKVCVERYTRHLDGCERNYDHDRPTADPRPCTCGLAELKEAASE